jgi:hypothetical protein
MLISPVFLSMGWKISKKGTLQNFVFLKVIAFPDLFLFLPKTFRNDFLNGP